MKKSFMVFMVSCAFIGAVQADLRDEYIEGLNKWQNSYPIIAHLRLEPLFNKKLKK